jgi:Asp-tRNA(Asn)/Glu-tRNA(Gln) amidotransferase A subunit family amidase
MPKPSRKEFLTGLVLAAAGAATASPLNLLSQGEKKLSSDDLRSLERLAGVKFTDEERVQLLKDVETAQKGFESVRKLPINFTTEPSTVFTPLGGGSLPGSKVSAKATRMEPNRRNMSEEDIAFASVVELGHLIRTKQMSPVELTELYLGRLKRYGEQLLSVVTLTEEHALQRARTAEREIGQGHYRGPLHGIPYGVKDLFATKGIPATWGAEPYKSQVFDFDATVVQRLDSAGAIMVAKLSMGALAMGDVWFRGTTKNPYNQKEGSSGSSAGSAASTAAGLVGFSIGTETLGSIVSPSIVCHATGLRPTYGRVSRYGGMALSYTMDKVGPICRRAEDTALVLAAICGADPRDPSAVSRPFSYPQGKIKGLKIGFLVGFGREKDTQAIDADPAVKILRSLGATVEPISFSPLPDGLLEVLEVESSSAFDEFTRSEKIDMLKNSEWPEIFRAARFVPAVEYLQAQRGRTLLMHQFEREFGDFDMFLTVDHGYTLTHTNLTGHPQIVVPWGVTGKGEGTARCLVGRLYQEDKLITVAKALQDAAGFIEQRPVL